MISRKQQGMSLVSLMVATAIGIFLIGAVIKIYLDSKNSFNTRNVVAEASENLRFALDDMRRIIVMAGRGIRGAEDNNSNRRTFPPLATNAGTASVDGAEYIYNGASDPDIIAIRYRRGPSCGAYQNVTDIRTRPSMVRFLLADTDNDGETDDLVCELTTYNSGGSASTTRQTLVSGIHMLKALYGVDDTDDGYADRYLTASMVNDTSVVSIPDGASTPWARVVSMRIALVSGSESDLPPNARGSQAGTLNVLGMDFDEPDTKRLYRVASTTLLLRNFNPIVQRQ